MVPNRYESMGIVPEERQIFRYVYRGPQLGSGVPFRQVNIASDNGNVATCRSYHKDWVKNKVLRDLDTLARGGIRTVELIHVRDLLFFCFEGVPVCVALPNKKWSQFSEFVAVIDIVATIMTVLVELVSSSYLVTSTSVTLHVFQFVPWTWYVGHMFIRFCLARQRVPEWLLKPSTIFDAASLVPLPIAMGLTNKSIAALSCIRVVRLVRVLDLFHNERLRDVSEAFRGSQEALYLLVYLVVVAMMIFSTLLYIFEQQGGLFVPHPVARWIDHDGRISAFQSIPATMWWFLTTITTVGFGNRDVPVTAGGKFVAGLTILSSIFLVSFPVVILTVAYATAFNKRMTITALRKVIREKGLSDTSSSTTQTENSLNRLCLLKAGSSAETQSQKWDEKQHIILFKKRRHSPQPRVSSPNSADKNVAQSLVNMSESATEPQTRSYGFASELPTSIQNANAECTVLEDGVLLYPPALQFAAVCKGSGKDACHLLLAQMQKHFSGSMGYMYLLSLRLVLDSPEIRRAYWVRYVTHPLGSLNAVDPEQADSSIINYAPARQRWIRGNPKIRAVGVKKLLKLHVSMLCQTRGPTEDERFNTSLGPTQENDFQLIRRHCWLQQDSFENPQVSELTINILSNHAASMMALRRQLSHISFRFTCHYTTPSSRHVHLVL